MTQYDLQKAIVVQQSVLQSFEKEKEKIHNFFHAQKTNRYFMLLCHEKRYYTLFDINKKPNALLIEKGEDVVIECLQNFGDIVSIDEDKTGKALECWVKTNDDAILFLLFNYDQGVIECV